MNRLAPLACAAGLFFVQTLAFADSERSVNELLLEHVFQQIDQDRAIQPLPPSLACPDRFDAARSGSASTVTQFIYNSAYTWQESLDAMGLCIYMLFPFERMLSADEARQFIQASNYQFPTPQTDDIENVGDEPLPSTKSDGQMIIDIENGEVIRRDTNRPPGESELTADNRFPIAEFNFPFNLTTMVQTGTASTGVATGSAIQLSPYTYATAAHVVINRATGAQYSNIKVFPGYRIPDPTTSIDVNDVSYDHLWLSSSGGAEIARDLAFLRTNVANFKPQYPPVFWIKEQFDVQDGVVGHPFMDPWAISSAPPFNPGCPDSWQRLDMAWYHNPACSSSVPTIYVIRRAVGYPDFVGTINNTIAHVPYGDDGYLQGTPSTGYDLYRLEANFPFVGIKLTTSPGQSGGPIFGLVRQYHSSTNITQSAAVLGVITNSLNSHIGQMPFSLGSGYFNYNWSLWALNINWNPNTFTATPNPVYTGKPNGQWTLSWNTPAYAAVDAYATNSLIGPQEIFIGSAPSPGSAPQINAVGMIATIRFFRQGDYTYPLGTVLVRILPN